MSPVTMPRARVIFNPSAGREQISKRIVQISEFLEDAGYETSFKATSEEEGSATFEAKKAAENGVDIVIAAGGDGTIHQVVNGLAGLQSPPKLAILPAGTVNDFARALKIPRNLFKACKVITDGNLREIDLGRCGNHYFANVAAVGYMTEVSGVPSGLKTIVGPLAYYMKVVEKLGKISKPFLAKISYDQKVIEEEIVLLAIANSTSVGGFSRLTPHADLSDGLLDILIIPKTGIHNLLQIASLAITGEHIYDPRITYFQAAKIDVRIPNHLKFNLDGEWSDVSSENFTVVPKRLQVFCP